MLEVVEAAGSMESQFRRIGVKSRVFVLTAESSMISSSPPSSKPISISRSKSIMSAAILISCGWLRNLVLALFVFCTVFNCCWSCFQDGELGNRFVGVSEGLSLMPFDDGAVKFGSALFEISLKVSSIE